MELAPHKYSFLIDHMLIKLGNYLRILGYDAQWDTTLRTHELILLANVQNRIFITRNTRLAHQYPAVNHALILRSSNPVEQLMEIISEMQLDTKSFLFSKCVKCNVTLDIVSDKKQIADKVHPNVYNRYETFYTCPECSTVFWKGGHVRNTCRKLGISTPSD